MNQSSRTGKFPVLFFRSRTAEIALALCIGLTQTLAGQFPNRTQLAWRTIETEHFAFHYPLELERWTRAAASHAEAIDSAVTQLVGFRAPDRTDVVVDDPFQRPNGSAWPYLKRPLIELWASPPTPRDDIGDYPTWGQMLVSHEFAHIVHLTRPSRNSLTRRLWASMPANIGPIALRAPRWVIEGYATYVEGRVTGSGRPHGAWRAAYLREWALEGQLPRYENLNSWGAYEGGAFAYLAGSAFIEWLIDRHGDSSFVNVWRRLSAKQTRSFDEAFTGVFGETPASLYGHFVVDLTEKSLAVRRTVAAASADTGAIVQRLARSTGDPAISADGQRVALVVRSAVAPSRVVIWKTAPEPDTARQRRDSLLLERDPEDVPSRSIYPPPKTDLFTLRAPGGASYESPRFLRDGRVLLSRSTARGDGTYADDLYLWDPAGSSVRRVTRGASVREADPAADGRSAIATRCADGWCSLVLVRLDDGDVTTLLRANDEQSFYRPRLSPDGKTAVVSVHDRGIWRLATVDLATRDLTFIDPNDGANRYDAAWAGANEIVAVSDRGGIANIIEMNLAAHTTRTLSSVTGAAVAPERNLSDGSVWFLSFYSGGYDLRRLAATTPPAPTPAIATARLSPALPLPRIDTIDIRTNPVSEPRAFGLTPRLFRWIPQPSLDADGASGALALVSRDVIGRSEVILTGAYGDAASWRGGNLSAMWTGSRPSLRIALFSATQSLTRSRSRVEPIIDLDSRISGGEASIDGAQQFDTWAWRARVGGTAEQIHGLEFIGAPASDDAFRGLAFGDGGIAVTQRWATASLTESLGTTISGGKSFGTGLGRGLVTAAITPSGAGIVPISLSALYGRTNNDAPLFEQFALGGGPSTLLDRPLISQRIVMPVLPAGISVGSSVFAYRAAIRTAPLSLYWWAGSTAIGGARFENWNRVVGLDWTMSIPSIAAAGTPAARGQFGIGESLDAPFRKRVRAYVSIVLNP
jgi:hypothetical protein